MATFNLFEHLILTMQSEYKKMDPHLVGDSDSISESVAYLDSVDPFCLNQAFAFAMTLYWITTVIYLVFKVFHMPYLNVVISVMDVVITLQYVINFSAVALFFFQIYAHFVIDKQSWPGRFVPARRHLVEYYLYYLAVHLVKMIVEIVLFYYAWPAFFDMDFVDQCLITIKFCGCGECYTLQKPLTRELLQTHEMFLIRQKEDSKEDVRITTIDPENVYNTECSTCFEDFSGEFEENESIVLTCRHKFHVACLHEWLLKEWDGAELVNMPGLFKKIRNETDLDPMHGMIYTSFCTDCRNVYAFILCKVQENKNK